VLFIVTRSHLPSLAHNYERQVFRVFPFFRRKLTALPGEKGRPACPTCETNLDWAGVLNKEKSHKNRVSMFLLYIEGGGKKLLAFTVESAISFFQLLVAIASPVGPGNLLRL
jgi:hypothetical protein